MKYLLIKKNKLPQIHETNNIPNVITKMFGRKFRILNENDIAYCRSQSVYATKLDLVRDCMWIGRYEQYGSNEEINRPLYAMVEKKHNSGAAIYGDFIITNFNFTSLTNEQVKYYNYLNIKEDLTMIYYYKYIERKEKDNILIINSISNSQYNACLKLEKLIKNTNIKKEEKLAIL